MTFTDSIVVYVLWNEIHQPDDDTITDQDCLKYLEQCGITQYDIISYREKLYAKLEVLTDIKRKLLREYLDTTNRQEIRLAYIGLCQFTDFRCANMDYWPHSLSGLKTYIESGPPENYLARVGYEWIVNGKDIPFRPQDKIIRKLVVELDKWHDNYVNDLAQEIANKLKEGDKYANT